MKGIATVLVALLIPLAAQAGWEYESETDQMSGKRTDYAIVRSEQSLDLEFPYKGRNFVTLYVRRMPREGTNVVIKMDKGQFICHTDNCPLLIKFDEAPPVRFGGNGPADHSSNVIFIRNEANFIARAKKAKTILIQANIFQNGAPVMTFNGGALVWPPAQLSSKR